VYVTWRLLGVHAWKLGSAECMVLRALPGRCEVVLDAAGCRVGRAAPTVLC
jgi:hypothetical protein